MGHNILFLSNISRQDYIYYYRETAVVDSRQLASKGAIPFFLSFLQYSLINLKVVQK